MRRATLFFVGLAGLLVPPFARAADPPPFALKDGDRVVLIGDTLIERDQSYGYLETLLTVANPEKRITFRNLGWSGDTVFGDARAGFGKRVDGFKHLKEHVLALKPTVILVGYGMSDSFEGEAGLSKFVEGLNTLLDVLAETKARIVLLSPIAHEDLGRPLPDPTAHNAALRAYSQAIARVASDRGYRSVDLQHLGDSDDARALRPLTDNGITLTKAGYWALARAIAAGLGLGQPDPAAWWITVGEGDRPAPREIDVTELKASRDGLKFRAVDRRLSPPPSPRRIGQAKGGRGLTVKGLDPGRYVLKVDGRPVATATAQEWAKGVALKDGPEPRQVEKLRETINEKNLLYFYRWRPQNETYLFGFRKHEQGNNAREIPLFDPLVEAKEKEFAQLRTPAPHVYELVRESEVTK